MKRRPDDLSDVVTFFGLREAVIVKDWYVTQALAALASTDASPFRLVFAGGTCLARAHRVTRRMSEDADFKVVLPDHESLSRSAIRSQLRELRDRVTASLRDAGFVFDEDNPAHVRSRNENHYTIYNLPYEAGEGAAGALRAALQIELTYAELRCPSVTLPLFSFVAEAYGHDAEVPVLSCISITETAAEKVVSVTRRTAAALSGAQRDIDPMLVRHIYDLHVIRDQLDKNAVTKLARQIAVLDAEAFKNQHPSYHADIGGETRKALTAFQTDPSFRKLYVRFLEDMVYGDKPEFDAAIETLASLADFSAQK